MPYTGPSIKDLANETPIRHAANMHVPFTVWSDDTARSAMKTFAENKIHSAPVVDRSTGKYVGILDYFDLVRFLSDNFENKSFTWVNSQRDDPEKQLISKFFRKAEHLEQDYYVDMNDSFVTAIRKFTAQPRDRHRALVVRQTIVPRGYLTERNCVSWLASNFQNYGHILGSANIKDLGLIEQPKSKGVRYQVSAAEAFHELARSGDNCLAILGDDDSLLATLSVTDIMGITDATFDRLRRPVMDYLSEFTTTKTPVTCLPTDSFELVLLRLAVSGLAQFWVVDERQHPIGLVGQSDVVQLLETKTV
jgi:CBS domain-containing protein